MKMLFRAGVFAFINKINVVHQLQISEIII